METPFIKKTVPCPMCRAPAVNIFIRGGTYAQGEVEADHHVRTYKWRDPAFQAVRPNHYYCWRCGTCGFTDVRPDFENATQAKNPRHDKIRPLYIERVEQRDPVLASLFAGVDVEKMTAAAALKMHLAAIYAQELLPPERRNDEKLFKLYLRTAWIYREEEPDARQFVTGETSREVAMASAALSEAMRQVERAASRCRDAVSRYGHGTGAHGMASLVSELSAGMEAVGESLRKISRFAEGGGARATGRLDVSDVAAVWSTVASDEREALRAAAAAIDTILTTYREIPGDPLALSHLASEIHLRLGNVERAMAYYSEIANSAHRERQALQEKLRHGDVVGPERDRMAARLEQMGAKLEFANTQRRTIEDRWLATAFPEGWKLVTAGDLPPETIRERLAELNFPADVRDRLSGRIKAPDSAGKKKRWGLF